jgi:hypothetical protein
MHLRRFTFVLLILAWCSAPGSARAVLKKPANVNPNVRVPQLIQMLRTDRDAAKRSDAAEELSEYDAKSFPEIATALIDSLQNDPESSVRMESASALGSLRPISQQAGFALEQAITMDSSMGVRMTARRALWQYYLLGYRPGRQTNKNFEQTEEPPLADPPAKAEKKSSNLGEKPPVPYKPTLFGNFSNGSRSIFPIFRKESKEEKPTEKGGIFKLIPGRNEKAPKPTPVKSVPAPVSDQAPTQEPQGPILNPPG